LYKFDSNAERIFAIVLENDVSVVRWMRPSAKQFNIYYGLGGMSRYEPDFIVETDSIIYMAEIKSANEVKSAVDNKSGDVWEKAIAGHKYCQAVTEWGSENRGKPWQYILIPHDEVKTHSSFVHLISNAMPVKEI